MEDNAKGLSKQVEYPLHRANPVSDISSPEEFISYYPTLFDSTLKRRLRSFNDSVIFEHNGYYGLVGGDWSGEIWLDEDGKISSINYKSGKEKELEDKLTLQLHNKIHPSVSKWTENILVAKSPNLLIRLDLVDTMYRYASWSHNRPISEKPDLILYNGVWEFQGTMGGWTCTFKNNDWEYTIDQVDMCEEEDQCGLFLNLSFKDTMKSHIRLKKSK